MDWSDSVKLLLAIFAGSGSGYGDHIRRDWSSLISIAPKIGITESQLDQMFIEASEL